MTQTYKTYSVPHSFTNPFSSLEKSDPKPGRINLVVPDETLTMFRRIMPRPSGVITTSVNILYVKLINEIIRRGLDDPSRVNEFVDFILNCEVSYRRGDVPNGTTPGTSSQAETPNVPGGVETSNSDPSRTEGESSQVQQTSRAKGRSAKRPVSVAQGGNVQ